MLCSRPTEQVCGYLQDQVDTLTFQSQSLRDRARRFEEALRKNTEEQLEVVTAVRASQHLGGPGVGSPAQGRGLCADLLPK